MVTKLEGVGSSVSTVGGLSVPADTLSGGAEPVASPQAPASSVLPPLPKAPAAPSWTGRSPTFFADGPDESDGDIREFIRRQPVPGERRDTPAPEAPMPLAPGTPEEGPKPVEPPPVPKDAGEDGLNPV